MRTVKAVIDRFEEEYAILIVGETGEFFEMAVKQNGGTLKALPVYLDLVAKVRETYGATENQKK